MNANELRIGNWVKYTNHEKIKPEKRNKEFKIIADDFVFLEEHPEMQDIIEPIALTDEWLLKFGFSKYEGGFGISAYTNTLNLHYDSDNDVWFLHVDNLLRDYSVELCEIMFVHELQNLYFAITGDELKQI